MKEDTIEYIYEHDRKDYSTKAMMEKMLKEIKAHLSRGKNVKVVLTKE